MWTIYLDMDGVCCDWLTPTLRLMLQNCQENKVQDILANWPLGEREVFKVLGVEEQAVWDAITAKGERFWFMLEEYKHYKAMWDLLSAHGEVLYLTSPPYGLAGVHACQGKADWIRMRHGDKFRNFVLTHNKHLLARPNTILVDDHEKNCAAFVKAGGCAILFPQPWNGKKTLPAHEVPGYLSRAIYEIGLRKHPTYYCG